MCLQLVAHIVDHSVIQFKCQEKRQEGKRGKTKWAKQPLSAHCCLNAFNVSFKTMSMAEISCVSLTFLSNLPALHTCWFTPPLHSQDCPVVHQYLKKKPQNKNSQQLLVSCRLSTAIHRGFTVRCLPLTRWHDECVGEKVHPCSQAGVCVRGFCITLWITSAPALNPAAWLVLIKLMLLMFWLQWSRSDHRTANTHSTRGNCRCLNSDNKDCCCIFTTHSPTKNLEQV